MILHDNAICQAALETFGKELQVTMAIEEMSELAKKNSASAVVAGTTWKPLQRRSQTCRSCFSSW